MAIFYNEYYTKSVSTVPILHTFCMILCIISVRLSRDISDYKNNDFVILL